MNKLPPQLQPLPSDVLFNRYRPPGDPGCLCSRCLLPIGEREFPIDMFAARGSFVLRYHPRCLGIIDDYNADFYD